MKHTITAKVGRYTVAKDFDDCDVGHHPDFEYTLTSQQLEQFELQAASYIFKNVPNLKGYELKFARKALGLNQQDFGTLLDVSLLTISQWEDNTVFFRRYVQLAVLYLLEAQLRSESLTAPKFDSTNVYFRLN